MAGNSKQKLKLLYLLDILKKFSDEQYPISTSSICERLEILGVKSERKSIYSDIDVLKEYGFDIIKTRVPCNGYFLASREFEVPEVRLLMDAVQSAGFISHKKTAELINKLEGLLSTNTVRAMGKNVYINNRSKCNNEEIYYNIDAISTAILRQKKITLKYQKRVICEQKIVAEIKEHKISPYAMFWVNDHYYLVGNNEKYENLMHLRIDRMKSVTVLEENYRHFSEVCEYKTSFDVADYSGKTFNMFGGKICNIQFLCNVKLLDQIIDKFGDNIYIRAEDDKHFFVSTKALVSDGLIGWILQFGNDIEIISPLETKEMLLQKVTALQKMYDL
ncbi:MAG: WYL domain-containing transcriptional regulator [Oscillospiraceae bacterium]